MTNEHTAKAMGRELPISTKKSIEIGNFLRGKAVSKAKQLLEGVIVQKIAVPMKRFNRDTGHKRGPIAAGRYPEKASKEILVILKSAEMNAQNKGLNTDALIIKVFMANKGSSQWRYGRQRRRQAKRTNIEIVLEEREIKVKNKVQEKKFTKIPKKEESPKEVKKKSTPKEESPAKVEKQTPKTEEKPKETPKEEKKE